MNAEIYSWKALKEDLILQKDVKMTTDPNDKAFVPQIEHQVKWIQDHPEAKGKLFGKEEELFYRATDYRGS